MTSSQFQREYKNLNPEQREAVETIAGPVMVVAGPGTGKTQILTLRIANILLKTDAKPENILALTFTESATANMRRRLVELIGAAGYYVDISTFHGFCNKLIQDQPENFPGVIGSTNLSPANQIAIVKEIVGLANLKHLKPWGDKFYYVPSILAAIKKLKAEGCGHDEFKKLTRCLPYKDKIAVKQKELALIYNQYQRALAQRKLYDFEDMLLETVSALKTNKDFLLDLQENYQYILVDEHQDTNGSQNKTLELLAGYDKSPNLFVVGDDKQAIFRFQGANLANFLYFKKKYPRAKIIELKRNYRSTQNILDASDSLIRHNTAVLSSAALTSSAGTPGPKITIASLPQPEAECQFVAGKIKYLLKTGAEPENIAVLYRQNKDALPLAEALNRRSIPHSVESDENILDNNDIKKLNLLFAAIDGFPSAEMLIPALHLDFLGLEPMELYRFLAENRDPFTAALKAPRRGSKTSGGVRQIGRWKQLSFNQPFPKLFETVIHDSGFLKQTLDAPNYHAQIKRLNALFAEIKNMAFQNHDLSVGDYLNHIALLKEHRLPLPTKMPPQPGAVRLMTAHKAKGLEFDTVFITDARNGHWGNRRERDHFKLTALTNALASSENQDKNEDERRLFYMAVTRSKRNVFVTYARTSAEGREQTPSQFIHEIRPDLKEEMAVDPLQQQVAYGAGDLDSQASQQPMSPVLVGAVARPQTQEKAFVQDLFFKRGLSPTSLNNYLACPWRFFYVNLLRIPQTETIHQIYGTAKHAALKEFFDLKAAKPQTGARVLVKAFAENIRKWPLNHSDRQTLLRKGTETLKLYHDFHKDTWRRDTINEFKIKGVDFKIGPRRVVRLTGKIDKIELDSKSRMAVVVDYKTKQPQSRNWILGRTKNSRGDYFRQLVFYKLLLDSLPSRRFNMTSGAIDFTEPTDKDIFKKEFFEVSSADMAILKETIAATVDEVLNLKFYERRCGVKDCRYCALRENLLPQNQLYNLVA